MRAHCVAVAMGLAALAASACSASTPMPTCKLMAVEVHGSVARSGDVVADLGEADNPDKPTAWQGPLKIVVNGGPACTASEHVSIIEGPLLLGESILYVPTYSGSESRLYAVNTGTCRIVWESRKYVGHASYADGRLILGRHHVPVPIDNHCRVEAASPRR